MSDFGLKIFLSNSEISLDSNSVLGNLLDSRIVTSNTSYSIDIGQSSSFVICPIRISGNWFARFPFVSISGNTVTVSYEGPSNAELAEVMVMVFSNG